MLWVTVFYLLLTVFYCVTSSGNYHFYIVNRFDSLIYEHDLVKSTSQDEKIDETSYYYQMIAHASLDNLDQKLSEKNNVLFYPNIDHHNNWNISAYVTPGFLRFIILYDMANNDGIKNFFQNVYETYIKLLLNPFYQHNSKIVSDAFDQKVKAAAKKFLSI